MFCKYLRNGSSDLYEILCGGQLLSCELRFQILWRSVHKWAHTSCKRARVFYPECARLWLARANLSTNFHEISNLSSQNSNWPPHKISWRSELLLRRYWQNNSGVCLILNFQCILHIFTNLSLQNLQRWIITEWL